MTAGVLFRRFKLVPDDAHKTINAWLVYVALPAMSFKYLPKLEWSRDMIIPATAPVMVWCCGWIYARLYAKTFRLNNEHRAAVALTSGLANTAFIGFPLILTYFGTKELSIAVICDQMTFLLLSTVGVVTVVNAQAHHRLTFAQLSRRIFLFPPFIASVSALIIPRWIDISPLDPLFAQIAGTVAPLALVSVGMQLTFQGWRAEKKLIGAVCFYKLVVAPLIIFLLVWVVGAKNPSGHVSIFEAAMPTLLSSSIVADRYNLYPKLVSMIIGISILAGLITTGIWAIIIKTFL